MKRRLFVRFISFILIMVMSFGLGATAYGEETKTNITEGQEAQIETDAPEVQEPDTETDAPEVPESETGENDDLQLTAHIESHISGDRQVITLVTEDEVITQDEILPEFSFDYKNDFIPNTPFRDNFGQQLDTNSKAVYNALKSALYTNLLADNETDCKIRIRLPEPISKVNGSWDGTWSKAIYGAIVAFGYDHPEAFWVNFNSFGMGASSSGSTINEVSVYPMGSNNYYMNVYNSKADILADKATVEAAAANIIATANTKGNTYQKMKYVHDWLVINNKYNAYVQSGQTSQASKLAWCMVSALKTTTAVDDPVCEGYSKAFQYICKKMNETATVAVSSNHMWNYARVNGYWYPVDCTWDHYYAGNVIYTYFFSDKSSFGSGHVEVPLNYSVNPNTYPVLADRLTVTSSKTALNPGETTEITVTMINPEDKYPEAKDLSFTITNGSLAFTRTISNHSAVYKATYKAPYLSTTTNVKVTVNDKSTESYRCLSKSVSFTVRDISSVQSTSITGAKVSQIPDQCYIGSEIEPNVTVTVGNNRLILNQDYELLYTNNKLPGKGKVQIKGIGAYKDTVTVYFNIIKDDTTEFVARLYRLVLEREPDISGINNWVEQLKTGAQSGAVVAKNFFFSTEFINKGKSDSDFVNILYRTLLGREPDAAGKASWLKNLNEGLSRLRIFKGFAESNEFTGICASYGITRGNIILTKYRDANAGITKFVYRCYEKALGRKADEGGMENWCAKLILKQNTPAQVAHGFIFSKEALDKNYNDTEFMKVLYRTCMGREADAPGLATWVNNLKRMTREQVFNDFVASPEFIKIVRSYGL